MAFLSLGQITQLGSSIQNPTAKWGNCENKHSCIRTFYAPNHHTKQAVGNLIRRLLSSMSFFCNSDTTSPSAFEGAQGLCWSIRLSTPYTQEGRGASRMYCEMELSFLFHFNLIQIPRALHQGALCSPTQFMWHWNLPPNKTGLQSTWMQGWSWTVWGLRLNLFAKTHVSIMNYQGKGMTVCNWRFLNNPHANVT